MDAERFDTVVIGAGQAGLTVGYHLREAGRSFVIVDGHERIGDNWRQRYDSLRLFTPPWAMGLDGFAYPGPRSTMPTRDQMADYLETYASALALPVRLGVHVHGLSERRGRFVISTDRDQLEADNVVVATGAHRDPRVPAFATDLASAIAQLHSSTYRDPAQLSDGPVLVVGVGNSGADIALELAKSRPVWLSGPINGFIPVDIDWWVSRHIAFRLQPRCTNSVESQSRSSGCVGFSPCQPKSSDVLTRPRPNNSCHMRLIATRAVRGLSGDTSQRASARRSGSRFVDAV